MQRPILVSLAASVFACGLLVVASGDDGPPDRAKTPDQSEKPAGDGPAGLPASVDEARGRARLLHEAFHATLQFVHDEYYRPDQRLTLPASTLERVFGELERRHKVRLRWLAVNAQAMNVDHTPRDEFEKAAVAALISGKDEFDRVEKGVYRYTGKITLTSSCLKCHLPARTDTRVRAAALAISIPLPKSSESP